MIDFSYFTPAFGCYVEINTAILKQNYVKICDYVHNSSPGTKVAAVIKADAYGHGIDACARALFDAGCRFFCVATLEEAMKIRASVGDNCDILILEYTLPRFAPLLAEYGYIQSVFSADQARKLNCALLQKPLRVHIKLDTGMNRKGFSTAPDAEDEILKLFSECNKLSPEGIFSHFYDSSDKARSESQYMRFSSTVNALIGGGLYLPTSHISCADPILLDSKYMLDLVRPGMALYGYGNLAKKLSLMPVMKLYGTVSEIHKVKAGESVGYGGTFIAPHDVMIATVAGGYADGIIRAYSGGDIEILAGSRKIPAKICGRICMDSFMAAFETENGVNVSEGDKVLIFGEDADSLSALAHRAGTTEYECLCAASKSRGKKIII